MVFLACNVKAISCGGNLFVDISTSFMLRVPLTSVLFLGQYRKHLVPAWHQYGRYLVPLASGVHNRKTTSNLIIGMSYNYNTNDLGLDHLLMFGQVCLLQWVVWKRAS